MGAAPDLHGALPWQQALYTGKGVKVGILDSSFDGLTVRLGSELPADGAGPVLPRPRAVVARHHATAARRARHTGPAVAESIIDMAPLASLYVSNPLSPADIAAAISWMTSNGVRIINYSRLSGSLLDGMGDGTSRYSDSDYALVDLAVAGGALFVASAGNEAETSWMGPATDADRMGGWTSRPAMRPMPST